MIVGVISSDAVVYSFYLYDLKQFLICFSLSAFFSASKVLILQILF
ncbi:hypothetical protein GCHA_0067 [Paraglaciecola chathamensis S18K6]|uniref:Uncharacterized protein n=1 Tax=Paraglaciecola chathamensis S18K6 TaxID=1127672 RepID=A0AAV3URZ4_9ALTE|nr:hypothetical protein GCHA_0067 [Paraglaciecola chathamensis S18K6]